MENLALTRPLRALRLPYGFKSHLKVAVSGPQICDASAADDHGNDRTDGADVEHHAYPRGHDVLAGPGGWSCMPTAIVHPS